MEDAPAGRRERKKAQTRQALADAALRLFLERGYDQVGVKEVADAADVSLSTLFTHFPSKETLVFDLDEELEAELVAVVRERPPGRTVLAALRGYILSRARRVAADPNAPRMTAMVRGTPALSDYARRMWHRHEVALARAIAADGGAPADDVASAALARFVMEAADLVHRHPDPERAARTVFDLLERGWEGRAPDSSAAEEAPGPGLADGQQEGG